MNELEKKPKNSFRVFISFYEVYNEKIFDLFSSRDIRDQNSLNGLEIRESKNGDV